MAGRGELVYVVPRNEVMDATGWRGVRTDNVADLLERIDRQGRFEPREAMEHDPSFKQVIPYLVLRDGRRYFLMRRSRGGGDDRLHERHSIGVGGHMNPGDESVDGALRREWAEELEADFVPDFQLVGLLNDDTTDVGAVHLGVVYVADAAGRPVRIRETDKLTGAFVDPAEVGAVADHLETWSLLVFEQLEGAVR